MKAGALTAGATLLDGCTEEERFIVQRVRATSELPGETVWRPGVCRQCGAGCGIRVRVVDGNARKIEGNEAHPVSLGGVCALGHSLLQELYNPDRVLQPLRVSGERGTGAFEPETWDAALASAVEAVAAADPERVGIVAGNGSGLAGALWRRFAAALGAPPPSFLEAPEGEVERAAARLALGTADFPYFDLARTEVVLSIGAPFLDRWRSPVHYTKAYGAMRRGRATRRGRLIQAEARMSITAANADVWLPVRPGTEGTLAHALGGWLLENRDASAAARQRYQRLLPTAAPTLAEAATTCDLREDRLLEVAEELAAAENALVMAGGSAAAHTNGLYNVTSALGLNLLLENLGRPGGVYGPATVALGQGLATGTASAPAQLAQRLRAGEVDVLVVSEADPVHGLPAGFGVADAIADVDTVVVLGSFMDDTALHADLLLPITTELERFEAAEPGTSVGVAALGLVEPVVEPYGEGRHPADILLALASGLGDPVAGRLPWSDFEEVAEERVEAELGRLPGGSEADDSGDYFDAALERGGIFDEGEPMDAPPGPTGAGPQPAGGRFEGAPNEYPFVLVPFESVRHGDGRGANRPWMQELPDPLTTVMWNCWVEISPADAEELGIHDQDLVRITSPQGSIELHAVVDPATRPGVISVPLGHGHRQYGRYAEGRGANVMALVGGGLVDGTSAPAWAATRVHIERMGEGELVRFGRAYADMGQHEVIPVGWAPHQPLVRIKTERSV
jgi:anaerobic selenocysteine-containing dehydrogenase